MRRFSDESADRRPAPRRPSHSWWPPRGRRALVGAVALLLGALVLLGGVAYAFLWAPAETSGPLQAIPIEIETAAGTAPPRIFAIEPGKSQARFVIDEVLFGSPNTVVGATDQVAGQLALNLDQAGSARVGTILINARTLATDEPLRDRSVRLLILRSNQYEYISFTPTTLEGLPASASPGETYRVQIRGQLTIHDIPREVTFDAIVTLDSASQLSGSARATVRRADWNLEIPEVTGVADVAEEARLELDFVATASALQPGAPSTGQSKLLAVSCTQPISDVYVIPDLPPYAPERRGDVVRCAGELSITAEQVSAELRAASNVIEAGATSGADRYRIAYRTERTAGVPGISTARLYLPTNPPDGPLPLFVVAPGETGIADKCAPSYALESSVEVLVLTMVASGYPVMVTDYAGLGTGGVVGWAHATDLAHSVLDAARAARKAVAPGALSDRVLLLGRGAGGGAVVSAQGLAASYGADGEVAAVATVAGGPYGSLPTPIPPPATRVSTITDLRSTIFQAYAALSTLYGTEGALLAFNEPIRAPLAEALQTLCGPEFQTALAGIAPTVQDLFTDAYRTAWNACLAGDDCAGPAREVMTSTLASWPAVDPNGAPTLVLHGLLDTTIPPARASGGVQRLLAAGLQPTLCIDAGANNATIGTRHNSYLRAWLLAQAASTEPPACSTNAALPAAS